jgi:hypothetical protein
LTNAAGHIDTSGEFIAPPIYTGAAGFFEGRAAVSDDAGSGYVARDGREAIPDKTGEMAIPPLYEATGDGFYDGLAAVRLDGEWGFVDLEGDMVIEPRCDEVMCFGDGLAPVRVATSWGYVNTAGTW